VQTTASILWHTKHYYTGPPL